MVTLSGIADLAAILALFRALGRCEALVLLPFVLENSFEQIAGHSDIERVATAGHDVGEVGTVVHLWHRTPIWREGM
jgi:hypothetical protein